MPRVSTNARVKLIAFKLFSPKSKRVSVAGTFNNWNTTELAAKKDTKGTWSVKANLKPGRYEYKFAVDGQWVPDPRARENVWNLHGTLNSVLEVRAGDKHLTPLV